MNRTLLALALLGTAASPLLAQGRRGQAQRDASVAASAAQTITEDDYRRRIGIIADDSMRGRGTPSPELEEVANHIAGEFRRFGLRPGGDNNTFLQRYGIRSTQLDTAGFVMVMGRGAHGHWMLGRDAAFVGGDLPDSALNGPIVLLYGTPADTARPFGDANLQGAVILHVAAIQRLNQTLIPMATKAKAAGARAWIVVAALPPAMWSNQMRGIRAPRLELVGGRAGASPIPLPTFLVRDSSAMGVLQAAGENLADLRAASASGVRALQGFTGGISARRISGPEASAPNVIGVLEGSDPTLKNEYIVFSAHMDHVGADGMGNGCRATGADSVCNGADDDASGTTGVVMLAQAFAQMNPRPRRSLVFMLVSGEERGLWGSEYYAEHPTLPIENTVANINLDMIGRYNQNQPGWRDTIAVIGKEHSDLGATANRVVAAHPELHMQLIDDIWPTENFYFRSDHYNFARKGVPILFFFNGTHPDYHRATDSVDKIDAEKAARITQMVYWLGLEVANANERPQWNPESRSRIVQ